MHNEQQDKLPLRIKLLYSTGDLSTSIPLTILMFFQLYFLPTQEYNRFTKILSRRR